MATQNDKAIVKRETVDVVATRVRQFQESGQLHLPPNYSAENAMKSAWLIVQETTDRDGKPALSVCTRESIANALLYMVVQALNPAKKQCYFIVYGKQLVCQRSYFGSMAVAKMVDESIDDIVAEVVYEGDTFKYKINRGQKEVVEHIQEIDNVGKQIKAAYCMVIGKDGSIKKTEVMTWEQIKQAWGQSKTKPVDDKGNVKPSSTHGKFPADMAKKTVINKACKPIINSSADSTLLIEAVQHSDEVQAEHDAQAEIDANANQEFIDISPTEAPVPEENGQENDPPISEEEAAEIEAREAAEAEQAAAAGPGF